MTRLLVLVCLVAGSTVALVAQAAPSSAARAPTWVAVEGGVQAIVSLPSAPFPHPGKPYGDPSVWVFVPAGAARAAAVDVVVHYHGFESRLETTVPGYRLVEQVVESGRDTVLVVPQGPVMARDGDFGKLMEPEGLQRLLTDVLAVLPRDGLAPPKLGGLTLSAHSGGYRAVARALEHGGAPVQRVLLFDALYGDVDTFAEFAREGGQLRSVHTPRGGTRGANLQLRQALLAAGRPVSDAPDGSGTVILATDLDHSGCLSGGLLATWLR